MLARRRGDGILKAATIGIALAAAGCATGALAQDAGAPAQYDAIIAKHSRATGVPEALIRRVIVRESKYNPRAMHSGHYGMMQIKPATAKSMGYRGSAAGLLDADVNLTYGVRYLAGAYRVAGGDHDRAVRYYASGYYYDAKRKGMLAQIGMGRDGALSAPPPPPVTVAAVPAAAVPAPAARVATLGPTAAPAPALPQQAAFVPTPPVRGALPAQAPVLASAAAVPMPQPRGPIAGAAQIQTAAAEPRAPLPPSRPADPRVVAPAAPQLAAAVPTPRSRATDPVATGSIASVDRPTAPTPPTRALASASPAQPATSAASPKTRVISPAAAPVLASAGPVAPTPPAAPQAAGRPAPAPLAFSSETAAPKTPFPPRR